MRRLPPPLPILITNLLLWAFLLTHVATGQEATIVIPEGAPPEVRARMMEQMKARGGPPGKPGAKKPDDKPKDGKKKEGEDKKENKDEKKDDSIVKRPDTPRRPPDEKELQALPVNGKLRLQFQGHPWPAMIDWYSRATRRDIQWQELPKDFVNLRTQVPITMEQTGDLLNRLLLAYGYTILDDGVFMQVVKLEGMNPAFVPRVRPQQLATMMPHSFVRTSFQLRRFKADEIVKEFEAMKSEHGKLTPMTAANRIEAIDTVRNLRDIYAAIDEEQSSGIHKPQEFEIKFVRAEIIKTKLEEMLGLAKQQTPLTPQQMQQMQQRRQQQQQNQKGKQPEQKKEEKISIIVNDAKNSVIVKAPPSQMLDIADAIGYLDVRPSSDSLDIKAYTLATRSPQELADMLTESGALSPTAVVRVDKKTKALLVSGTQFDHFRIEELVKRVDGNARRFVSIRLRRYPARQVATTIEKMMGEPKEENNNNRYRYWGYWGRNNDEEDNDSDKFRVAADVENNRLILKCNNAEYDMVISLLEQMGEILSRAPKGFANQVVLDDLEGEDELLRRVQEAFKSLAPNAVVLPQPVEEEEGEEEAEEDTPDPANEASNDAVDVKTVQASAFNTKFVQLEGDASSLLSNPASDRKGGETPPPIFIERDKNGRLVLRSKDPVALEQFEELMRSMAPRRQDWVPFRMKHVTATWMKSQLEDFFDESDESSTNMYIWDYWGGDEKEEEPPGLGDERKMRFISDGDLTLVVRNASAKQLATIRKLIALYDVVEPPNEQNARFKEMIPIRHSKARTIETALKEAFRDLLSNNDKAFANQNKGGDERDGGSSRRFGPWSIHEGDTGIGSEGNFKGRLSFGVDESTNILIVTATGKNLLEIVVEMVKELDKAAVPSDDTRVYSMPASLNSVAVRETLARMFGPEGPQVNGKEAEEEGEEGEKPEENGRGPRGERRGG